MDFDQVATIGVPLIITQVIAYFATIKTAGKAIDEKVSSLERSLGELEGRINEKRASLAEQVWKAIQASTDKHNEHFVVLTRENTGMQGTMMQRIADLSGDIREMKALLWEKKQDQAGQYAHKPDEASAARDAQIDKMLDRTQTKEERETLKSELTEEVASTKADSGARALLEAMGKVDDLAFVLPAEPHDKAPDQTLTEKREDEAMHLKRLQDKKSQETQELTTEGPSIITITPKEKEIP